MIMLPEKSIKVQEFSRHDKRNRKIWTKCHMRQLLYQSSTSTKTFGEKLTIVGTLRENKPELPLQFAVAKGRKVKSTLFGFQNDAMIASSCPKKNCIVPMLLAMHWQPDVTATSDKKPDVISYYSSTKEGVAALDRMVKTYTCKRIKRRWPAALFYKMIDVNTVNAFIVWLELNGESSNISRKDPRNFLLRACWRKHPTRPLSKSFNFYSSAPKRKNDDNGDKGPKLKRQRCSLATETRTGRAISFALCTRSKFSGNTPIQLVSNAVGAVTLNIDYGKCYFIC